MEKGEMAAVRVGVWGTNCKSVKPVEEVIQLVRPLHCPPCVLTMRVDQRIPDCGVVTVSQDAFRLRGSPPDGASCHWLFLDQAGVQWLKVNQVVIRLPQWGEGSRSICIPHILRGR